MDKYPRITFVGTNSPVITAEKANEKMFCDVCDDDYVAMVVNLGSKNLHICKDCAKDIIDALKSAL